ncbi:hypothetical protein RF11_01334 [Thelohanellus kitauei]|uniref:Uncharacterized protein n=1 Tax=Thelohanellus kitauei TaxID=669202 RepID=A0A0C2IXE9_THEKT|nr:hypothetical protein RF11_01334 [Thelohanellus kitauei]
MDLSQNINEFVLNFERMTGSKDREKLIGVEWMTNFEESITKSPGYVYEVFARVRDEMIGNVSVWRQSTTKVAESRNHYADDFDNVSFQQMFYDIFSIVPDRSKELGPEYDEFFSKRTDISLMRELLTEYEASVIDLCSIKVRVFPPTKICDNRMFMAISIHLREVDLGNIGLLNACDECILTYIQELKSQPFGRPHVESCLFFITGLITDIPLAEGFHELINEILNIGSNAPSELIETCCRFFKSLIDHFTRQKMFYGIALLPLDSIYTWLAKVSGQASKLIQYDRDSEGDILYINNILVFCPDLADVKNLAKMMGNVIKKYIPQKHYMDVLKHHVKFYSNEILQVGEI